MACSRFRRAAEELGDVGQRRRRVSAAVVIRRTLCSTRLAQTVETVDVDLKQRCVRRPAKLHA